MPALLHLQVLVNISGFWNKNTKTSNSRGKLMYTMT